MDAQRDRQFHATFAQRVGDCGHITRFSRQQLDMTATRDIVVIGGGLMGLSIATELSLRGASVTILDRDRQQAAGYAAAGMLAPQAEALPPGPLLNLCLESRDRYADWVSKLETLSGQSVGYRPCGILRPFYADAEIKSVPGDRPASPCQPASCPTSQWWFDADRIHQAQPGLGPDVVGGWWFSQDGQVDNVALMSALVAVAEANGVVIESGVEVTGLRQQGDRISAIQTNRGHWSGAHYVLATGAWSQSLIPVPVVPCKGQMMSLLPPNNCDRASFRPLSRVLFGDEIYIVPRQDGRIVLGATVEWDGFSPGTTAAGLHTLLSAAIRLFPQLADWRIHEQWWGFRPTTPDEAPMLGPSHCNNLSLAIGHHRNGVLMAPITAAILGDWILNQQGHPLLPHFSWTRFQALPRLSLTHQRMESAVQFSGQSSGQVTGQAIGQAIGQSIGKSYATPLSERPVDPASAHDVPIAARLEGDQPLVIAGRSFQSRLMTGTGKYRNLDEMQQAIAASGCQIVTVAVRRVQTNAPGHEGLAEAINWNKIWMLPNTAGCKTAEDAVRVARLGREMAKLLGQEDNNFVKLEVIPDAKYLLPDPIGTLEAAEQLVNEGFAVLPYINADPLLAKRLQEAGCATVMPLGSPIGSGQGIRNAANIRIIIESATVPVVVDAGIGTPSEAVEAMEMGADALLINTAIAQSKNPALMGRAMGMAAQVGRMAYLSGRIPIKDYASASSPLTGTVS